MLLQQAEIQAIQNGDWEVDCVRMTLTQNATNEPQEVNGSGYLRRDRSGQIRFKLYSSGKANSSDIFSSRFSADSGTLISDSSYYRLRAEGMDQRTWEAARILPSLSEAPSGSMMQQTFTGIIPQLSSHRTRNLALSSTHLHLVLQTDASVPWNSRIKTQTSIGGSSYYPSAFLPATMLTTNFGQFTLKRDENTLRIMISSSVELPAAFESRVVEALTFVLATPLRWSILMREDPAGSAVIVRSVLPEKISSPMMPKPIAGDIIEQNMNKDVWQLFETSLIHICGHTPEECHPYSQYVLAAIQASAADITSWGLALSIAVEGIVRGICSSKSKPDENHAQRVKSLRDFCLKWEGFSENEAGARLQKRVEGFLGSLLNTSPKDMLYSIAGSGDISVEYISSWDRLRNALAHGAVAAGGDQQEFIDLCYQVATLVYQLLFCAIGYTGSYKDYGTRGWPVRTYPHR